MDVTDGDGRDGRDEASVLGWNRRFCTEHTVTFSDIGHMYFMYFMYFGTQVFLWEQ